MDYLRRGLEYLQSITSHVYPGIFPDNVETNHEEGIIAVETKNLPGNINPVGLLKEHPRSNNTTEEAEHRETGGIMQINESGDGCNQTDIENDLEYS